MKHVYIHIPFCNQICSYCDFCKFLYNKTMVSNYLDALEKEINEYYMDEVMDTIYIGGGTPSCLTIDELEKLFKMVNKIKRTEDTEFTFECNPENINEELLDLLIKNGVNRISMGIESFNPSLLKLMNRNLNFDEIKAKISLIRAKGINNLNLDLIYALPNETMDILKKDVKLLLKLNPEHISTYSLMIENNTLLKINGVKNIDEDADAKMYDYIRNKLKRKGYIHYEVSNFAKPNKESKHNNAYWLNQEYYGFGLGASGYMNGFRYDNEKNLNHYLKGIYHLKEALLSKQEIMDYEVILGLRLLKGINLEEFYDKYNVNIQDVYPVKPLVKSGELKYKNGYLFINPDMIYVMNEILLKLV
jgi:oxygen-independent coproporphyrinogen III oxidase